LSIPILLLPLGHIHDRMLLEIEDLSAGLFGRFCESGLFHRSGDIGGGIPRAVANVGFGA
jgi:hypothetical protein